MHTTNQWLYLMIMLSFIFVSPLIAQTSSPNPDTQHLLWSIGEQDNRCLEFALTPNNYLDYQEDPYYVVGFSNPQEDWCYIHPGPKDEWANAVPHIFTIVFYMQSVNPTGDSVLQLHMLDANRTFPPQLYVYINNTSYPVRLPPTTGTDTLINTFDGKTDHSFQIDIPFPTSVLKLGENVIQFVIHSGSWLIYDAVLLFTPPQNVLAEPTKTVLRIGKPIPISLVWNEQEQQKRLVHIPIRCYNKPFQGTLSITNNPPMDIELNPGNNSLFYKLNEVSQDTFASIEIKKDEKTFATRDFVISPAKHYSLYLLPHSHNDIGYTHIQTEVERIQQQHIQRALELIQQTKDYPPEAQFHWSAEVLWAVKKFYDSADTTQKEMLKQAIKKGYFELPALYANQLTGLCNGEELFRLLDVAHQLAREIDVTIDSAWITDVPGYVWGIIPVLAQAGVKYFSVAPNLSWRVGNILDVWGDKPFYWVSPSRQHKVLTWIGLKGYSTFFGGTSQAEDQIKRYLVEIEERQFPYDILIARYSIISDNGPPDESLPDFVKAWNEKYISPKLIISTATKVMKAFEEKYGDQLPTYGGTIAPYWEDGSASSARETAINRSTVNKLMLAETLWALWFPDKYPAEQFQTAWENAILYDEHTWGAHNSITEPDSPFVKEQWAIKQAFALNAQKIADELIAQWTAMLTSNIDEVDSVAVINPSPYPRSEVVILPSDWKRKGNKVLKGDTPVPSQPLTSGELAFYAKDIPPWGYAIFTLNDGEPIAPENPARATGNTIGNEFLQIQIHPQLGTIQSLIHKPTQTEWILENPTFLTNQYLYVQGRNPENLMKIETAQVEIKDHGPLVATIEVYTQYVPSADEFRSRISINAYSQLIHIQNTFHKQEVRIPESVHIAFSFNIPNPTIRYHTPFAIINLPEHHLPGSCMNYLTAQHWIDLFNNEKGVTLFIPDTPMFELGKITVDPAEIGWKKGLLLEPTMISYVMNNYWETNYRAFQEGLHTFNYYLYPYLGNESVSNLEMRAKQILTPMLVIPTKNTPSPPKLFLQIEPVWTLYHLRYNPQDKSYLLRLFNPTSETVQVTLKTQPTKKAYCVYNTLSPKPTQQEFNGTIQPHDLITLWLK